MAYMAVPLVVSGLGLGKSATCQSSPLCSCNAQLAMCSWWGEGIVDYAASQETKHLIDLHSTHTFPSSPIIYIIAYQHPSNRLLVEGCWTLSQVSIGAL